MENRITEEVRKFILDDLVLIGRCSGKQSVGVFSKRVFPDIESMTEQGRRGTIKVLDEIIRHMDCFNDWTFNYLFDSVFELPKVSDEKFIVFCEQYVNPIFSRQYYDEELDEQTDLTEQCILAINKGLSDVGLSLQPSSQIAGRTTYKVESITKGVQEPIKNIIFAAKYKPDIVLDDALSNDIKIVNSNGALIYDQGIPQEGISWSYMIDWYSRSQPNNPECELVEKFYNCMDSEVEKILFKAYFTLIKECNANIPALIPQVYMYYDPKTQKQRDSKIFEHQKMDFMMIISSTQRIVIEVDGQQHYSEDRVVPGTGYKRYASPTKYADMMKAHRDMSLAGYDVYRFGGKELTVGYSKTEENILTEMKQFYIRLFEKYNIDINKKSF